MYENRQVPTIKLSKVKTFTLTQMSKLPTQMLLDWLMDLGYPKEWATQCNRNELCQGIETLIKTYKWI